MKYRNLAYNERKSVFPERFIRTLKKLKSANI